VRMVPQSGIHDKSLHMFATFDAMDASIGSQLRTEGGLLVVPDL
jgi:hypothetical protein